MHVRCSRSWYVLVHVWKCSKASGYLLENCLNDVFVKHYRKKVQYIYYYDHISNINTFAHWNRKTFFTEQKVSSL